MQGYRGEPWTTDGKYVYDRDGYPFAKLFDGAEEFGKTICLAVNLLNGVPLRDSDGAPTPKQAKALNLLTQ